MLKPKFDPKEKETSENVALRFSKLDLFSIVLLVSNFLIGLYFAPMLPDQVPTHWDFKGHVNGYSGKEFAVWQMPLLICVVYLLMTAMPHIDPRKRNYAAFANQYSIIKILIVVVLSCFFWISIAAALNSNVDLRLLTLTLIGGLFVELGTLIPKVKQNYFVGFRTPWAIENEEVWVKTQKAGSLAFIIGGILMVLTSFAQQAYLFIGIVITMIIAPFIYSYMVYRNLKK